MGRKLLVVCRGSGQPARSYNGNRGICARCGKRVDVRPDGKVRNHKSWVDRSRL